MKKIAKAAGLALLTVLLTSGCAGSPDAAKPSTPAPPTAQESNLIVALNKIDPALGTMHSVDAIRRGCRHMTGTPEKVQLAAARALLQDAVAPAAVTDATAHKVLDAVAANGICKTQA